MLRYHVKSRARAAVSLFHLEPNHAAAEVRRQQHALWTAENAALARRPRRRSGSGGREDAEASISLPTAVAARLRRRPWRSPGTRTDGYNAASLQGPRRMASFWAMMYSLSGNGVLEKVQKLIRPSNSDAQGKQQATASSPRNNPRYIHYASSRVAV